jgi:ketosteroid isomerase-like protein
MSLPHLSPGRAGGTAGWVRLSGSRELRRPTIRGNVPAPSPALQVSRITFDIEKANHTIEGGTVDDYEAIRQLTARYNRAFDERDATAWLACWMPDGRFEFLDRGTVIAGHAALAETIRTVDNTGRHTVSDFVIEVRGDQATQSCHLCELGIDDGQPVVRRFGRYTDDLVRDDGTWRFAHRRLRYG